MALSAENIQMLKDIIEGRKEIFWHKWWEENAKVFEQQLGRTDFLKIKFDHLNGVTQYLDKIGVDYTWSPQARKINTHAKFHKSMFDEEGKLKTNEIDRTWKGAIGIFNQSDTKQAMEIFNKMLSKALKNSDDFNDLEYDLEGLFGLGEEDFSISCLKIIALLESDDDLILPAIQSAKNFIKENGN